MGRIKRREKGNRYPKDARLKAMRDYTTLKRQLNNARKSLLKVEKERSAAMAKIDGIEKELAEVVEVLLGCEEIVVSTKKEVDAFMEFKKQFDFKGEVAVAATSSKNTKNVKNRLAKQLKKSVSEVVA